MRALPLLLLAACSGPDTGFTSLLPGLAVAPERVAIGEVGVPLSGMGQLFVTNAGKAPLEITATFEGDPVFEMAGGFFEIAPSEEHVFDITFTPETFKKYSGRVRIESNDEAKPIALVPVSGEGVDLPFPDIHITPSQTVEVIDVPSLGIGWLNFSIVNLGESDLELLGMRIEGPPVFELASPADPVGYIVPPAGAQSVLVQYTPVQPDGDSATLFIESNDPDEPEVEVVLIANGGGDFDFPVAVIDCPTEVRLTGPEVVEFDGSDSYDPLGLPISYKWEVTSRPDASDDSVDIDPDTLETADIYVDVGGPWEVQLQVFNVLGTPSEPAFCSFDAVPEDDLHVELSWDTASADMDLHLARGGVTIFQSPDDCNFCNQNPNWGANGGDDDPRLDIDDRGGYGPENINILTPEDGVYDVRVHYWERNGDGPVIATVRIWTLGNEEWVGQRVMLHDEVWDVGQIDMPTGAFFSGVLPNYPSPRSSCTN